MIWKPRRQAGKCPHPANGWELCADGLYCPQCQEGVCECCRTLWQPTGATLGYPHAWGRHL